jgi:ISXO2-like transposase domain
MIAANTAASIEASVRANVTRGATLLTAGHPSYPGLTDYRHDPRVVGKMAGHVVLPWIDRVFALLKRWSLGTYHGLRRKHVDTYLDEFVFRTNRRFYRHVSFETVLAKQSSALRRAISRRAIGTS